MSHTYILLFIPFQSDDSPDYSGLKTLADNQLSTLISFWDILYSVYIAGCYFGMWSDNYGQIAGLKLHP